MLTDSESLIQDRTERVNDVSQVASADFCLVPGKISTYKMMFAALPESVNDRIEVGSDMQCVVCVCVCARVCVCVCVCARVSLVG